LTVTFRINWHNFYGIILHISPPRKELYPRRTEAISAHVCQISPKEFGQINSETISMAATASEVAHPALNSRNVDRDHQIRKQIRFPLIFVLHNPFSDSHKMGIPVRPSSRHPANGKSSIESPDRATLRSREMSDARAAHC
jgi:hypothetical protein